MDSELAGLCEQYFKEAFLEQMTRITPLMRAIPVNRSIEAPHLIATYDDAREMLESKKIISLAKCVCRVQQNLIGQGCGKPLEICLSFGANARHYIDQGLGRRIGLEEALKALDIAEEAGCVLQLSNTLNPGGLCCCCGDCCAILRSLNRMERPADIVVSNYFVVANPNLCTGCEICLDRCQMGAITMNDEGLAQINPDRCLGCGLCVTRCPEALRLERKLESRLYVPPANGLEALEWMAGQRGKSLYPDIP
jgi:NAD-dependent dihydropyrimidine dehydrogenase PreA subunit